MNALVPYLQKLTVRAPHAGDEDFLKRLYASARSDLRNMYAAPEAVASLIEMQQKTQAIAYRTTYPDAEYGVLEENGEAVGRIVVNAAPREMRLVDIAFLPQARGRGLGTAVLRALQGWAAEKRVPLTLSVNRNNPNAKRLYLALGFQTVGGDALSEQMAWRKERA